MTDITRPDPAAAPGRLELAPRRSRPAAADRDLGRAILDSPLVRGAVWLRWSGHDSIRTLHHGAGLARGWTERDVDGLDGWVALVEGRIVLGQGPDGRPEPIVHAEAWDAGATLHAALAQHPARPDHTHDEDDPDSQEHALLGDVPHRVRRRAAGMTLENIQHALEQAQFEERCADRHADAGHETAYTTAATIRAEWQRIHDHTVETRAERYDPDHDTALQHALRREHHRQNVAACAPPFPGGAAGDTPSPFSSGRQAPTSRHRVYGTRPASSTRTRTSWSRVTPARGVARPRCTFGATRPGGTGARSATGTHRNHRKRADQRDGAPAHCDAPRRPLAAAPAP
ncbi:hypothetical protein ACIGXI_39250 [Kitasatospora aureofaciens]|uniref:hypothetical protein n=1 Tax=Kitasatospora aureofaciens TaxID=1894 RepID=UPI0037CB6BAD